MSANHIIVPQGWRYGAPVPAHAMRITKAEARLLLRNGAIEEVDVMRRLWRLRIAEICDSTYVQGGRLALGIEGQVRGVMAREMGKAQLSAGSRLPILERREMARRFYGKS